MAPNGGALLLCRHFHQRVLKEGMGRESSKYPGFSADSKRLLIAEGSLTKPAALAGLSSTDTSISSDGTGLSGGTSGSTFPGSSGLLGGCLGALIPPLPCLMASLLPTVPGD